MTGSERTTRRSREYYVGGITGQDRVALSRAITVMESESPSDRELAAGILDDLLPLTGRARRVGITGAPGAGKSTFIDALGLHIVRDRGEGVAVLSIDPSSPVSHGSILGDKTRMERLSAEDKAFIRPTPARGRLGGVAGRTRETVLLCEAAGYHNILVETVGVGQSEVAVRAITDFFLLLMIPGAGDELQGVKRGIIEMLDAMAVNKADGATKALAERTRGQFASALHLFPPAPSGWMPRVLTCSALTGDSIPAIWEFVLEHRRDTEANGFFERRREEQSLEWMRELVESGLQDVFRRSRMVVERLPVLTDAVASGSASPVSAARELLRLFLSSRE